MRLIPLGERVIILPSQGEERTKSGIYLPKSEEKKQGEVVEVGEFSDSKPLPLKKGDKVIYSGFGNEEFEIGNMKYLIVEFKDVIAKLEDN